MKSILFAIGILLLSCPGRAEVVAGQQGVDENCFALQWQESADIAALFQRAGVSGAFVLFDVAEQRLIGVDYRRVKQRFVPASTFKVVHTLIGLDAGAVSDVDEALPWDGRPQPFPAWEQDMSLRQAIAVSNVAIYQQLARRIGLDTLQRHIDRLGYGNTQLGPQVDRFWLDGPLQISLLEQVRLLAALAAQTLPYSQAHQARVREILRQTAPRGVGLFAKSGWQNAPEPGVGWWVGWLEKDGRVYAFGLNLDIQRAEDAPQREALARASLALLGLL